MVSAFITGAYVRSRNYMVFRDSRLRVLVWSTVLFVWCLFQFAYVLDQDPAPPGIFLPIAVGVKFLVLVMFPPMIETGLRRSKGANYQVLRDRLNGVKAYGLIVAIMCLATIVVFAFNFSIKILE